MPSVSFLSMFYVFILCLLQNKMKLDMKEFESDFERLHMFLVGEQALLLHQLEDRYEILLARQNSNITHLEEQSAALSRLIAEAEDKSKQDGLQLLKVDGFSPFPHLAWLHGSRSLQVIVLWHSGLGGGIQDVDRGL